MKAVTIAPEHRKHFVFLFDLGLEYFNVAIAADPREVARSLEYDVNVYHAQHAKLSAVVHSEVDLNATAFAFEGRELLGELVEMGAIDFEYMLDKAPDAISERYTKAIGEDLVDDFDLDMLYTKLVCEAHAISFG